MSAIDVESFVKPISDAAPCGEDLSHDRGYAALEQLVAGTPERQMGETFIPAQDPDWKDVREAAATLLKRSRDLRLMVYLTLAAVRLDGVNGVRDGLAMLRASIDKQWDNLYPRLDPDDDNDPLERMNILQMLCSAGGYGDPVMFDRRLRETPLCKSRQWGAFGLRDLAVAKGEIKLPPNADGTERKPIDQATIDAAFKETPIEELQATGAAVADSLGHVKGIDALLNEKAGESRKVDLSRLVKTLMEMQTLVGKWLEKRGAGGPAGAPAGAPSGGLGAPSAAGAGGGMQFSSGSGPIERQGIAMDGSSSEIRTQQDVLAVIEAVCKYYERYEPSSPVPLMLKATRRLIGKNFIDIMKILSAEMFDKIATIANEENAG